MRSWFFIAQQKFFLHFFQDAFQIQYHLVNILLYLVNCCIKGFWSYRIFDESRSDELSQQSRGSKFSISFGTGSKCSYIPEELASCLNPGKESMGLLRSNRPGMQKWSNLNVTSPSESTKTEAQGRKQYHWMQWSESRKWYTYRLSWAKKKVILENCQAPASLYAPSYHVEG